MRLFQSGFSLLHLLFALAISGILAVFALQAYQYQVKAARLREAHAALLKNAQFMERFYLQTGSFKKTSTSWPTLPIGSTDTFCLRPHGVARGALDGKFTLKAVALNPQNEPRILKINESLATMICETSSSSCDGKNNYFSGSDKQCTVYHP